MIDRLKTQWKPLVIAFVAVILLAAVTVTSSDADAQNRTLYWGSRGDDVKKVQTRLSNWGYYDGAVDGIYGPKTFNAVKSFQTKNGLTVDGTVGRQTWGALGYPVAEAPAPQQQAQQQPPAEERRTETAARAEANRGDIWLLSRVVMGEAADEPYTGKVAVAAVVLNRVNDPAFPNTLSGVVYQPLAFESVANAQYTRAVSDDAVRAAEAAMNGWDPTNGALYFWNPYKPVSKWIWTRTITSQIGNHVFGI